LHGFWFVGVTQIFQSIIMLALALSGAAVIREREHGTIDHLLVMPVGPAEIMVGKILASSFVILIGTYLALHGIIAGLLAVPLAGSVGLFMVGTVLYVFVVSSMSIFLATVTRVLDAADGASRDIDRHCNAGAVGSDHAARGSVDHEAHAVAAFRGADDGAFRGAGFDAVWPFLAAIAAIGAAFFAASLAFFRRSLAAPRKRSCGHAQSSFGKGKDVEGQNQQNRGGRCSPRDAGAS
jgi:ABC-2 type transport system permease protein